MQPQIVLHNPLPKEVMKPITDIQFFDCCDDCSGSMKACCCGCLVEGELQELSGGSYCTGCVMNCCFGGLGHAIFRGQYLRHMGLQDDIADLIFGCVLPCCSQVQLRQQLKLHKKITQEYKAMSAPTQQIIIIGNQRTSQVADPYGAPPAPPSGPAGFLPPPPGQAFPPASPYAPPAYGVAPAPPAASPMGTPFPPLQPTNDYNTGYPAQQPYAPYAAQQQPNPYAPYGGAPPAQGGYQGDAPAYAKY